MQKVRRHPLSALLPTIGLRPLVSVRFQVLFTQLKAVLFIVQSPYWFTIGHRGVFSLGRWSARLHAEFHELRATLVRLSTPISAFIYGTVTLCGGPSQALQLAYFSSRRPQPRDESRFGLFPLSLAATDGIDVSFFSCGYLDVSVPRVGSHGPMHSGRSDPDLSGPRFRIQKSPDQRPFAGFPGHIAGYHVFRRLSMPRHPPYTLSSLATFIDHRRKKMMNAE